MTNIPRSIGVIVDGNRRWAKERGLPTLEGHRAGYAKLKEFATWARDADIGCVIAFVFSTENWNRAPEEVSYLMDLLRFVLKNEKEWAKKEGIRIRVLGSRERLSDDIVALTTEAERETAGGSRLTLVFALNYGGRAEIARAARMAADDGEINEESIGRHLYTADIPDPDMIVRTSGEHRLSNFLPWQSVYSELLFLDKKFPELTKKDFVEILNEYARRERRFGK